MCLKRQPYKTCKFSQFLNLLSSLPKIQVIIWRAFMLARTTPRLLYQWAVELSRPPYIYRQYSDMCEKIYSKLYNPDIPATYCARVSDGSESIFQLKARLHCDLFQPTLRWTWLEKYRPNTFHLYLRVNFIFVYKIQRFQVIAITLGWHCTRTRQVDLVCD